MKQTLSNGENELKYPMLHRSRQNTIALANRLFASYKALFSSWPGVHQYSRLSVRTADSEFFGGRLIYHSRRKRRR